MRTCLPFQKSEVYESGQGNVSLRMLRQALSECKTKYVRARPSTGVNRCRVGKRSERKLRTTVSTDRG